MVPSEHCKGQVKITACIEDPAAIERILAHLNGKTPPAGTAVLPGKRAPRQARRDYRMHHQRTNLRSNPYQT